LEFHYQIKKIQENVRVSETLTLIWNIS